MTMNSMGRLDERAEFRRERTTDNDVCASFEPPKKILLESNQQMPGKQTSKNDHARGRTWNLLIRSQAPCHWATQPLMEDNLSGMQ
jgi:hypothetical protein